MQEILSLIKSLIFFRASGGFTIPFSFHFSDSLDHVQVTAGSPVPMPQVALGLIPTKVVSPPQPMSAEQVTLQFQKKLEELEQQVKKLTFQFSSVIYFLLLLTAIHVSSFKKK